MVFGLSSGGETLDDLAFFIEEFQLEYPVMFDAGASYTKYNQPGGTSPYPLDYIIDQDGKVAYFSKEYDPDAMTAVIDNLLGKAPDIRVEPASLDFGPVALGESVWSLISVFNDGQGDLHVESLVSDRIEFVPNQSELVIAPGTSQALLVEFSPTELGPVSGNLSIASDDADEPLLLVPLYGEGMDGTGVDFSEHVFNLLQNDPNPFSVETGIRFSLLAPSSVLLTLYDPQGRRVRHLGGDKPLGEGVHRIVWDGRDDQGRELPSGVYFYTLRAGDLQRTRKAILLR